MINVRDSHRLQWHHGRTGSQLSDLAEPRDNGWRTPLNLYTTLQRSTPTMSDPQEAGEPQPLPESSRLALPPRLTPSPDATEAGVSWFTYQPTFQAIYQPYHRIQTIKEARARSLPGTSYYPYST